MTRSRAVTAAAVAQTVLALYLQAIEWIPMFPWNDLSHGNGQEVFDGVLAVVSLLLIVGVARGMRWVMLLAAVANVGWLALQIQSWWIPYLNGASPTWRRVYAYWFASTWRFLPPIGDHPVPDAAHVTLHVLLCVAAAVTLRAWYSSRPLRAG